MEYVTLKKFLYITIAAILVIGFFVFYPRFTENRISPKFDPVKMDEVKNRNAALLQEMLDNFDKAADQIKADSDNVSAWVTIGTIADTFGDDALAEKAYKKAIALDASLFLARHNLAALYLRQEKYAEAEAQYKIILQNNPADIQTNENLARLYASEKIGTKADAKKILEDGIAQTNDLTLKELLAKLNRGEDL